MLKKAVEPVENTFCVRLRNPGAENGAPSFATPSYLYMALNRPTVFPKASKAKYLGEVSVWAMDVIYGAWSSQAFQIAHKGIPN